MPLRNVLHLDEQRSLQVVAWRRMARWSFYQKPQPCPRVLANVDMCVPQYARSFSRGHPAAVYCARRGVGDARPLRRMRGVLCDTHVPDQDTLLQGTPCSFPVAMSFPGPCLLYDGLLGLLLCSMQPYGFLLLSQKHIVVITYGS